jgi:hypothetical protein
VFANSANFPPACGMIQFLMVKGSRYLQFHSHRLTKINAHEKALLPFCRYLFADSFLQKRP